MAGDFDVVVTDGFTGNVRLKTIEGTAKTLMRNLKARAQSPRRFPKWGRCS